MRTLILRRMRVLGRGNSAALRLQSVEGGGCACEVATIRGQSDLGPSDCAACGGDEADGSGVV